jgi:hypothetical protein
MLEAVLFWGFLVPCCVGVWGLAIAALFCVYKLFTEGF